MSASAQVTAKQRRIHLALSPLLNYCCSVRKAEPMIQLSVQFPAISIGPAAILALGGVTSDNATHTTEASL